MRMAELRSDHAFRLDHSDRRGKTVKEDVRETAEAIEMLVNGRTVEYSFLFD